ncbi:MAG: serine/threonine-protein kinase [Planctomycetota bacterium]
MTKTVSDSFVGLIRRSQLVEDEQLERALSAIREKAGGDLPDTQEDLAKRLIEEGILTQWQVDKLLAGKYKGFKLGKYKLLGHLGKGGMSSVYAAEHTLMNRKVAIKVLPSSRVEDATYLERFRIEARATAKLDDPNIVRIYDFDQDGKTHYLVMEFVDGKDLHVLVKTNGPLDYNTAANYIAQAARGLAHAHAMGLVHRDIKPANCLVDSKGTVKVLDMGLARLIGDEASLTMDNNENVLGTADYLAPEQARDSHGADERADIYGLGCTLYFLLTGHPPFPEGTITERLLAHQRDEAPSILIDRPDAPPSLVTICNRMMAKNPADRYQTAQEVADRMADWLADRGVDVASGSTAKPGGGSDGVGSDIYGRFAAALSKAGTDSGSGVLDGGSSGGRSTPVPQIDEEDLELAPLEEDSPQQRKTAKSPAKSNAAKATESTDHGVLSQTATPTDDLTSAIDTVAKKPEPKKPKKSLIEEALEAERSKDPVSKRPSRAPGEIDPLRPPGYSGPRYGPPVGLYVGIGVGVSLLLLVLVVFYAFG